MNQKQLAAALGISPAGVCKLAKRGMPTSDLDAAKAWREQHLDAARTKANRPHVADGSAASASATPYTVARTQRERTRAAREHLELERLRGKLVDTAEVEQLQFTAARIVRDRMEMIAPRAAADLRAIVLALVPEAQRDAIALALDLHAFEARLAKLVREALADAAAEIAESGLDDDA